MAYNEFLADRVRGSLKQLQTAFGEKKMFGGLCFMVDDKMCVGIIKDDLMVRIDPDDQEDFLQEKNLPDNGFYPAPHERLFICNTRRRGFGRRPG